MQSAQFELHARIEEKHWWFVARRSILARVIASVVPPCKETTIIDVGCGTGANLASLADAYRCVGIDTSADAIALARRRFPGVTFIEGFAPRDLGGAISDADLILLCDVLEHVRDDFALLSNLLSAARPGTRFLITVPADVNLWSAHDEAFGHYRRYDAARLAQLWQDLDVRPIFVSPFNARLCPLVRAVRTWNQWRGTSSGESGTDFQLPSPLVNRVLAATFAGEANRLARLARGERVRPYRQGVSLMALVERGAGPILPRAKPIDAPADLYEPTAELAGAC